MPRAGQLFPRGIKLGLEDMGKGLGGDQPDPGPASEAGPGRVRLGVDFPTRKICFFRDLFSLFFGGVFGPFFKGRLAEVSPSQDP